MPRKKGQTQPAYRFHQARNCAVVTIDGRNFYLGPYQSPESHEQYARLIGEWQLRRAEGTPQPAPPTQSVAADELSVNACILRYLDHAATYYVGPDGKPSHEFAEIRRTVQYVKALYGSTLAKEFGPLKLKTLRQHLIETHDLSLGVINQRVARIVRMWEWLRSEELIPGDTGLTSVKGLKKGRTTARETVPVKPADERSVAATLQQLSPTVAAMVKLQRITGMRPGEVCRMRACDIDRSGPVWIYTPATHKNAWRGLDRMVPMGTRAQAIVQPFLDRAPEAYLFAPAESNEWWRQQRLGKSSPERKTKVYPSELKARARRQAARGPRKGLRERYTTAGYNQAIGYGIKRAQKADATVQHWHANQLRHSCGTELRKLYGVEAAQVALGHARLDATQIYAARNLDFARRIAAEVG